MRLLRGRRGDPAPASEALAILDQAQLGRGNRGGLAVGTDPQGPPAAR